MSHTDPPESLKALPYKWTGVESIINYWVAYPVDGLMVRATGPYSDGSWGFEIEVEAEDSSPASALAGCIRLIGQMVSLNGG